MQYSPKLKKAAEEIKEILKRYDIAASVVLHTPGFSEFVLEVSPSYSCAKPFNGGIHFKAKKSDYDDLALWHKTIQDTSNMMHLISTVTAENAMRLINVSEQLDKLTSAEHDEGEFTSHTTQNN